MTKRYGKHVLITGASSGLGYACATLFAQNGYEVWGLSRSCEVTDKKIGDGVVHFRRMNVNDQHSIDHTLNNILESVEQIGIVIHCAGFGIAGPASEIEVETAKDQFETNYFGVLRVNRSIIPHMQRQKKGLIIVIGSVAGLIAIPFQSHYSSSKYALEAYVEALRMETFRHGIQVTLVEPGDTNTGFTNARKMCLHETSVYADDCQKAVSKMAIDERKGKSPNTVAKVALALADRKKPPIRKVVGFDYKLLVFLKRVLPSRMVETIVRKVYMS